MIILTGTDAQSALHVIDSIRKYMEHTPIDPVGIISFSAGITQYVVDDTNNDIIIRADRALYKAKASGRNCVKII